MKRHFTLILAIAILAMLPLKYFGQEVRNHIIELELEKIENPDLRFCFLSNIANDSHFTYTIDEENNSVLLHSADHWDDGQFQSYFNQTKTEITSEFNRFLGTSKDIRGNTFITWKESLPQDLYVLLFKIMLIENPSNRPGNQTCATSDPFCTTDIVTFDVAANPGGACESGPDYGCLSPYTARPPFWFHMKIGVAGAFTIRMTNSANVDIDYCCWGPFSDPVTPCPTQLTGGKLIDCGSSGSATETCQIPNTSQVGQYYIMVITKYEQWTPTSITFQKTEHSGPGETDCGIVPAMVSNGGPYCVGDVITLRVNTQEGATYSWTGPNGFNTTQQNPSIPNCTMAMAGTYTCTTTVGTHSVSASTNVEVSPKPTAGFSANAVCLGGTTRFTNTSTTNPANQAMTYQWDFGDGQASSQQNPSHQFSTAGSHNVSLTVTCGNGTCVSTATQNVIVYDNPVANAGSDQTVQYGGTAQLRGSGGNGSTTNFNYHWEPANKVTNPNAQNTQTVALNESTTFTLTVTHPQGGCSSTDETTVLVQGSNMTATASASPAAICLGETSQLRAQAVGGTGNFTYSWSPSIGLSNPLISNPIATPSTTTTYTCTVSDGMSTQNITTTVTVNLPEHEDIHEYICPGETFQFYDQSCTEEGNYEHQTTTAQGCEKTITLHLHHYPSYENAHTTTASICPGEWYEFHGEYFNTEGTHSVNLHTTHGCDSIVKVNLTVYPENPIIIDPRNICTSQTLTWFDGNEYSQDGDVAYYDSVDYHGCLQVYQLELHVSNYQTPPNYNPDKYECVPYDQTPFYHWDIADKDYYQDTRDTIIVTGPANECDYLYTLNLQFHQEHYFSETKTACDSYTWDFNGEPFNSTDHHITRYEEHPFGPNQSCQDTHVLDLTINHSTNDTIQALNQCDKYEWQFGWNNETYSLTEQNDYTKTIDTYLGCDSTVTLKLQLDYTPSFEKIIGNQWVVGGSEFQYTVENYKIETDPKSTHETNWTLFDKDGHRFEKWEIIPYDNGDKCYLYIYTFERDSIRLHAQTRSTGECECGGEEKDIWIHCGYHGINETSDLGNIDIFPNPNDGNMTLSFDNLMGEALVKIYNITGTLIDQFTVHNEFGHLAYTYQSGKFTPGVYFFTIANKKGLITKKVVVID